MATHNYEVHIVWTGTGVGSRPGAGAYSRDHDLRIEGKPTILGSSDPGFSGDPARHNPEELLVAALSQCHMLWYLSLCHRHRLRVVAYSDRATGMMHEDPATGGGHFTEVTLHPEVLIEAHDEPLGELANSLHGDAGRLCFIANSVNFPVRHEPTIRFTPHADESSR